MNYKRLGNYIREVDVRNEDDSITNLLGINIDKYYMPSVANVVGTDLSRYKVVEKNQFACNRMHVGRDKRLPIALSTRKDKFIISPAYDVFEIIDRNELLPEYLMMWFSRKEFDRNTWFYTDADVRGGLNWNTFLDMQLPIPSPEKQREIVAEYNVIQNRINLNNQLIQKLEETAQAIYKEWFVDFEFPNEEGKPYKSSGGEMEESELGEIPKGWRVEQLSNVVDCNPETLSNNDELKDILYLDTGNITNNKIENLQELDLDEDEIPSRARRKVKNNDIIISTVRPALKHFGLLTNTPENLIVSTGFAVLRVKSDIVFPELIYSFITDEKTTEFLQAKAEMSVSTYPSITADDLLILNFVLPDRDTLGFAQIFFNEKNNLINLIHAENKLLNETKNIFLSKMATIEN
ncbi:restriction endonuclease subunit S [Dysgonomonas sp. Marseille-P4361]|uniref:restriction endonuclease subunit S n=1 Tax=Dysgonomonas sp. Marseille-P4361 TaxID=2161820 RepID=UPI000D54C611|nr:restriction endonuclease subunit S [Dysgonomonas sp. Marseille-P4361]